MITFLALAHMLDATQHMGGGVRGMIIFVALAHMLTLDANVNHSLLEFCRQVHGLNQRPITAGTPTLDRAWQDLIKRVPSEIRAKDGETKKVNFALRSWMWRRNCKGDLCGQAP